jgi:hypothetical protein
MMMRGVDAVRRVTGACWAIRTDAHPQRILWPDGK